MNTQILVSIAAALFLALILFGSFIYVKFLILETKCKRASMIVFYSLTLVDLAVRMAIMVSLNFKPIFATEPLTLSVVALMLATCVGTSHSFILTTLIIDLKTLQCRS